MTGSDFMDADCALLQIIGGDQCKMNNCEFDEAIVHETSFYKSDIRQSSIERLNIFNRRQICTGKLQSGRNKKVVFLAGKYNLLSKYMKYNKLCILLHGILYH
jgi:hypothetical protein